MTSSNMLFLSMVLHRVYYVEHVEILGDGLPSVKTLSSVDVVVYDEQVIVLNFILDLLLTKTMLTSSLIRHQR